MDPRKRGRGGHRLLGGQPHWFTLWNGCVTEVYFPTIDRPQVRDLQYLVTDGQTLFHDERKALRCETERSSTHALSYGVTCHEPEGRYRIVKEVIAAPHLTRDEWRSTEDVISTPTAIGIAYADVLVSHQAQAPIRFTFLWTKANQWEGLNHTVMVVG
jgi:hypothetical protein